MKRKFIYILFIILSLVIHSCKTNSNRSNNDNEEIDGYKDGDYCAKVSYYYHETGTSSIYTLKVGIENNELVKIYWPNGGWLDESHFNAPDISDGDARFESDKGVEYKVTILGEDGDCRYDSYIHDNDASEDNSSNYNSSISIPIENYENEINTSKISISYSGTVCFCGNNKEESEVLCKKCRTTCVCGNTKASNEVLCNKCKTTCVCGNYKSQDEALCRNCLSTCICGRHKASNDVLCKKCRTTCLCGNHKSENQPFCSECKKKYSF